MTYKKAYDKIIEAYFKDEIKPCDPTFCFCGTLCGKSDKWYISACERHRSSHGYKGTDFVKMEKALLFTMDAYDGCKEDALFAGMLAALDVLREIHIQRGEVIDETTVFTKRNLQPCR